MKQRALDVFSALADPTRRTVLDRLLARPHTAGELAQVFPHLCQPAVSRHLRVLREAGLIQVRVDAQRRIYTLQPEAFAELNAWLSRYREFWTSRLDALSDHLDHLVGPSPTGTSSKET